METRSSRFEGAAQQTLFDEAPEDTVERESRRLARHDDPETSHEAAKAVVSRLGEWHLMVFAAVRGWPGSTASELAASVGHATNHQFSRRLPELERAGKVKRGQPRTCKRTGRSALTWWPVKKGETNGI